MLIRGVSLLLTIGACATGVYLYVLYMLPANSAVGEFDEQPGQTAIETEGVSRPPKVVAKETPIPDPVVHILDMAPGEIIWSERDDMAMAFIPAGAFVMGNANGSNRDNTLDEYPAHEVVLIAYFIDTHEVTNAQYRGCVEAGVCEPPQSKVSQKRSDYFTNPTYDKYPVIKVTWQDAQTYCQWVGRDLPTEAEWEKAAGWDFQSAQAVKYPWGVVDPESDHANFGLRVGDTSAVAQYPDGKSSFGVMDMSGNVWEWVYDWYGSAYYEHTLLEDPLGPEDGLYRVMRGGSWISPASDLRVTKRHRLAPQDSRFDLGFRCVWRPES